MTDRKVPLVRDEDVFVVTAKGDRELRGAATSLSPAQIELLVRADGVASLADIRAAVRSLPAAEVAKAFDGLVRAGLVEPAPARAADALDFNVLFSAGSAGKPAPGAVRAARAEASAGIASLQKHGYYVRIARRPAVPRAEPAQGPLTVLVVEDEGHLAKFLAQYLMLEGFDVRIAGNRTEIVAALRQPPLPALVLLDVMLPDADGFDVLARMREHPVMKAVPVIMLTAKATREAVLNGLARGANGYVTKPFEAEVLLEAVRAVLGIARQGPGAGGAR